MYIIVSIKVFINKYINLMFSDFQKQENIKFDINELRQALKEVLKKRGFDDAGGVTHFGGISLNQIPGKPESTKGNNVRGIFWTKPNDSGIEEKRDIQINEAAYTGALPCSA